MKRRELRRHIFEMLFRAEFNTAEEMDDQMSLFLDTLKDEEEVSAQDEAYITEKSKKIMGMLQGLDEEINEAAKGWKTSRMGKVELTILRLAVFEMKHDEDVPVGVAINEAVELTRKYEEEEVVAFVNGILGSFARDLEQA